MWEGFWAVINVSYKTPKRYLFPKVLREVIRVFMSSKGKRMIGSFLSLVVDFEGLCAVGENIAHDNPASSLSDLLKTFLTRVRNVW